MKDFKISVEVLKSDIKTLNKTIQTPAVNTSKELKSSPHSTESRLSISSNLFPHPWFSITLSKAQVQCSSGCEHSPQCIIRLPRPPLSPPSPSCTTRNPSTTSTWWSGPGRSLWDARDALVLKMKTMDALIVFGSSGGISGMVKRMDTLTWTPRLIGTIC